MYQDTKFDFGMYSGYELGIVYLFDQSYIEWCIENIKDFVIIGLYDLLDYKVIQLEVDRGVRETSDPSMIPLIDVYETFDEFLENADCSLDYEMPIDCIELNESKLKLHGKTLSRDKSASKNIHDEIGQPSDYIIGLMEESEFGFDSDNDDYSGDRCPACGTIGDPYCCNYQLDKY